MSKPSNFGRNLLAIVGVVLLIVAAAVAILMVLSEDLSPYWGLGPVAVFGGPGILMVFVAAFYDSAGGRVRLPGWRFDLGAKWPEIEVKTRAPKEAERRSARVG